MFQTPRFRVPRVAGYPCGAVALADKPPVAHSLTVRHPPQSGWLDEWGRLKGGHPSLLAMTHQRGSLEFTPIVRVLVLLFADVGTDLFQLEAHRGHRVAPRPEVLTREVALLAPKL